MPLYCNQGPFYTIESLDLHVLTNLLKQFAKLLYRKMMHRSA